MGCNDCILRNDSWCVVVFAPIHLNAVSFSDVLDLLALTFSSFAHLVKPFAYGMFCTIILKGYFLGELFFFLFWELIFYFGFCFCFCFCCFCFCFCFCCFCFGFCFCFCCFCFCFCFCFCCFSFCFCFCFLLLLLLLLSARVLLSCFCSYMYFAVVAA